MYHYLLYYETINHLSFSKPGRPPSKKGGIGDRKALTRPRRPAINGSEVSGRWRFKILYVQLQYLSLFGNRDLKCMCLVLAESDDDHEELVAAIQAAVNAGCKFYVYSEMNCSLTFW